MGAITYKVLQRCKLTPEEIRGVIDKVTHGFIYKGEDFYNEVKALDGWEDVSQDNEAVNIWTSDYDDAGVITVEGKEIGLFIHYDEDAQKYDWARTYEP